MKRLKNVLLLLAFLALGTSASAQFGVGAGLAYITDFGDLGIWGRANYQITEQWRGAATFTLHFAGQNVTVWQLGLDANYLFWGNDALDVYAIGGLNFVNTSVDLGGFGNASNTSFGVNLGGGAQFKIESNITPVAELKLHIGDGTFIGIFGGIQYRFGE